MENTPGFNFQKGAVPRVIYALRRITGRLDRSAPKTATVIRRKPSYDFSITGLVYCSMMMFMGLAAINSQVNLLFGVFGLMIGILLVSGVVCRLVLSRMGVHRVLPEYPSVGQTTTIQYYFYNRKRFWPSLSVTLSELDAAEAFTLQPHAYMLHAAPRMTAVVPVEVIPKRRGLHRLGSFQLSTSFPFGFIKRALEKKKDDSLLIFPAIGEVSPRLLAMCVSADRTGANMKPRRGGQDEFYGVKQFREGENPRWIHWKRTARTGELVAKEMTHVSPPRLLLLVDTYIYERTEAELSAVERTIAMAASLANRALEAEMSVGLCVWADGWTIIPAQRGKRHCRDILAALATVPINQTAPAVRLIQQGQTLARSGSSPILFAPRPFEISLSEHARGSLLVVAANSEQARAWFKFDPKVKFDLCMPEDQQADMPEKKASRRKNRAMAIAS